MQKFLPREAVLRAPARMGMDGAFTFGSHRERKFYQPARARIEGAGLPACGAEFLIGRPNFGVAIGYARRARWQAFRHCLTHPWKMEGVVLLEPAFCELVLQRRLFF